MKRNAQDGLRFSFGLNHEEVVSAKSTPKFPSVQVYKCSEHHLKSSTQQIEGKPLRSQAYQQIGGRGVDLIPFSKRAGNQSKQKVSPLLFDNESIDNLSHKSVKSLQTGTSRFHGRKYRNHSNSRQKMLNNSIGIKNFWNLRRQPSSGEAAQEDKGRSKVSTFRSLKRHYRSEEKSLEGVGGDSGTIGERKQTKKIVNSFFEIVPRNIEFRQTKKTAANTEKASLTFSEREKNKYFKTVFQKVRPTLRISGREIDNNRLQSMTRMYESGKEL